MSGLTEKDFAELGRQLHKAIAEAPAAEWPLSLNLFDHKRRLGVSDRTGKELFEIKFGAGFY